MQVLFGKPSHQQGVSAPLQPRFGSLRLLGFPKAKIAIESEEICECDSHTATQAQLTASHCRLTSPTGEVTVQRRAVNSPLSSYQVTSRSHDRFSRYLKWLDTFRTALVRWYVLTCRREFLPPSSRQRKVTYREEVTFKSPTAVLVSCEYAFTSP